VSDKTGLFDFNLSHILLQLLLLPAFSVCKWWWCK